MLVGILATTREPVSIRKTNTLLNPPSFFSCSMILVAPGHRLMAFSQSAEKSNWTCRDVRSSSSRLSHLPLVYAKGSCPIRKSACRSMVLHRGGLYYQPEICCSGNALSGGPLGTGRGEIALDLFPILDNFRCGNRGNRNERCRIMSERNPSRCQTLTSIVCWLDFLN